MTAISLFFVHSVDVETLEGNSAVGEVFAAPVAVSCFVDDSTHLVRNGSGEEVVSSTIVYAASTDATKFPADSRVTVNGRTARVITLNDYDSGPLGLPDHAEIHLT